jgi:class 3 adenylate cyclase/predicted ATPase
MNPEPREIQQREGMQPARAEKLQFGGLTLDLAGRALSDSDGRDIALTRGEFELLCALTRSCGRAMSRDQLLDEIAGRRAEPFDRSVDVMIARLRRKIEPHPKVPRLILTVPGFGYKFAAPVQKVEVIATPAGEVTLSPTETILRPPERRHVSAVAIELVADDGASLPADPEEQLPLIDAYRRHVSDVVLRHGGSIGKMRGREVLAFFGHPIAQEHAVDRAIHTGLVLADKRPTAPLAMKQKSATNGEAALSAGLAVRVAIASGVVVAGPADDMLGEAPSEAVRLLHQAEPNQVIISASTYPLVDGLFVCLGLKPSQSGRPEQTWQVLGPSTLGSRSEALFSDTMAPLVGREEELALLLRAWQSSSAGKGRLVMLCGEPGIGKSRLLAALESELASEQHLCLRYFCSPLYQDSALYPLIARCEQEAGFTRADSIEERLRKLEVLLAPVALPPEDVALIAGLLGLATGERFPRLDLAPQRRKERTLAVLCRRLFAAARRQPVLMLFEDAHWVDPSSLEFLDALVGRLTDLPLLLIVTFRPEFGAPWIGRPGANMIALGRLDRQQSAILARRVFGEHERISPVLLERILEQADGVPLFIEELTKAVAENVGGRDAPCVPNSLQASLMARLDRLPLGKPVAQVGAVIGREFPHPLLAAVAGVPGDRLAQGLDELIASGLAARRGSPPEATYAFKHALVRDAAYESLLTARRTAIHSAVVAACEEMPSFDIEPGVLAHHCARAGLVAKAAFYYRIAGERSIERAAALETRAQLERGLEFAASLPVGPERDELEAELLLALANILQTTTSMSSAEAAAVLDRAVPICRRLARTPLLSGALWGQFVCVLVLGKVAAAQTIAEELLQLAEACGEVQIQVTARSAMGIVLYYQGQFNAALQHLVVQRSLLASASEGAQLDWRTVTAGPAFLALTLACLGYPDRAANQLGEAMGLASRKGSYALAYSLSVAIRVLILLRDDTRLRECAARLVALSDEGGFRQFLNQGLCALGWLEARTGAAKQGLERLRDGLAGMLDLATISGLPFYRSLLVDTLAEAELRPEALIELEDALQISSRSADAWFSAELNRKRGELLLADPSPHAEAAEAAFQRAVAIAREQSANLFALRAATSLARLWDAQGKRVEARQLLASVYSDFAEGFDTPDLEDARALLVTLADS